MGSASSAPRSGRGTGDAQTGPKQSAARLVSRAGRGPVGLGHLLGRPVRGHHDVLDQDDPLAPVVEGGQLADHHQGGVGVPEVVGRGVGQVLHLAHHVVAEVAHHPPVQGRQVGHARRAVGGQHLVQGGQHPPAAPGGHVEGAAGRHLLAAGHQRGQRGPADERVPAPALAALHRLEQEARALADDVGEGGHRGEGVGHHLGPHRHDGVTGGQLGEAGGVGPDRERPFAGAAGHRRAHCRTGSSGAPRGGRRPGPRAPVR